MTVYNDQVSTYITDLFAQQDEAHKKVLEAIPVLGLPQITIQPEEGRFFQFLLQAVGARKVIEIGTLGGYSGIWLARGLPAGGRLYTLEKEPDRASIARKHFEAAGVADKVEIREGDAHDSLVELENEGPFDFVFIDAEKTGYQDYYEWGLQNLRMGGVIAAHNAFRKGSVVGLVEDDDYSALMRSFNRMVAADKRVISTIYPAGDGTLLAVKIG